MTEAEPRNDAAGAGPATGAPVADPLQAMLDSVLDCAIYRLDAAGRVRSWHGGAERMLGYWADEIVGQQFGVFHTAAARDAGEPARELAAAAAAGRYEAIVERIRRDGSRFWAEVAIQPIRGEGGAPTGFVEILRDISERRAAAERRMAEQELDALALLRANETLQAIIEAAPLAIFTTDEADRVTLWNSTAEQVYGVPRQAMMGPDPWPAWNLMAVPGSPSPAAIKEMVAAGDGTLRDVEVRRRRPDGSIVDLRLSAATLHGPAGRIIGYVYVADDMTRRRAVADQLRKAQRLEAIGQLTAGIAHDFNNLLAIVQGNLELINERLPADGDLADMASEALVATQRGATLTHRLLAYSRRQQLAPVVVDIRRQLGELGQLLRRVLEETIRIETVAGADLWPVCIDPGQLENALLNLALNSRDAMPEGGTLSIGAENALLDVASDAALPAVLVTVRDTGTGMSRTVVERALEPFFTTKPVGQGTGLGLSMVYGFVKQSGGHLEIASEPGRGTAVKLYLPASAPDRVSAPVETPAAGRHDEHVLVVEDDATVRRLQVRSLRALGYHALEAADGPAALALIEAHPEIDLLLTDVVLPAELTGPALAQAALARRPALKIVFMSGYAAAVAATGDDLPERPILSKPFTRSMLAAALDQQFGRGDPA